VSIEIKTSSPRERLLLRQANQVANQGKLAAAQSLYEALVAEFPDSLGGYLGLARLAPDEETREDHLRHALTIDAKNEIVLSALEGASIAELLNPPEPEPLEEVEVEEPSADSLISEGDAAEGLRCNRCGKPIDAQNAIRTPVGYRCRECIREVEEKYFTATAVNYVAAIAVALPLSIVAALVVAYLLGSIGFFSFIITLFASPTIGTFVATLAFRVAGKNRGRYMPYAMSACIWIGALLALALTFNWIVLAIYAISASSAAFLRVR
jgi:hypothetical protein